MTHAIAFFLFISAVSAAAQVSATVQIYNMARISPRLLADAMATADQTFASAAITLHWQRCLPECVEDPDIPTFIVGIVGADVEMRGKGVLGFAMLGAGKGNRAVVSIPRVEEFAESVATRTSITLGYAIAHELGHLIARSRDHSTGIMLAHWNKQVAARMQQGSLRFTRQDGETMRCNLMGERLSGTAHPTPCLVTNPGEQRTKDLPLRATNSLSKRLR